MNCNRLYPLLERAAKKWPNEIAISSVENSFTYSALQSAANGLASQLLAMGIKPSDKVGVLCANGPAYVIASFALFAIDGILVPIFPGLKQSEVNTLAVDMKLDAFCCEPHLCEQLPSTAKQRQCDIAPYAGAMPFQIYDCTNEERAEAKDEKLGAVGAPLLRFTSGTTSRAKGVIIPQSAMIEYTKRFATSYNIARGDRVLNLLSMAHIFYQVTTGLLQGAQTIVHEITDLVNIARTIKTARITHIEAAPSFYSMLLNTNLLEAEDFRGIKYITSCGAALPNEVAGAFRDKYQREIVQRYGLTETGPVLINLNEDEKKRGTLGTAVPGCEIKLEPIDFNSFDQDHGEILVRCPGLFYGYYSPWTPAETVLDGGWFHTGDVASKDAEGFFRILGRTKIIINVGGVKVFPNEIEDILRSHPAVDEALVYGAPDPRFGEAPRAKVKLKLGSHCDRKGLLAFANQRLSLFKALRDIDFVYALPKTATGKLKRSGG